MTNIEWDQRLATGDDTLDNQHRHLFAMFNELHDAAEAGVPGPAIDDVLDQLSEYVMVHFEIERRLMDETRYGTAETSEHLAQHEDLTNRTRDMILAYRRGELTSVMPLALFLADWLKNHIRETDMRLVEHVCAAHKDEA